MMASIYEKKPASSKKTGVLGGFTIMMGKRVLIVDDESNIRLTLRICLEREGYQMEEAANGKEALDMVMRRTPDIVLLDLSMPVLGGMEVLKRLREAAAPPPVIILTAYGSVPNAVEAIKLGAVDFLEKPVTPEAVRTAVARVLAEEAQAQDAEDWGVDAVLARQG